MCFCFYTKQKHEKQIIHFSPFIHDKKKGIKSLIANAQRYVNSGEIFTQYTKFQASFAIQQDIS